MPPKDAPQLSEAERQQLLGWITMASMPRRPRGPGPPRASDAAAAEQLEYDNAIRDLTGVDIRPTQTREFPVDSVGGEGFANVGTRCR